MKKLIAVLGGCLVGCVSKPVIVQEADTYNSWPMVQALGKRLVCAYSRGSAHSIDEGKRGVFVRHSDDAGRTWSDPEILFIGEEERPYDAGNVNVTVLNGTHYAAFYTGTSKKTAVLVLPVEQTAEKLGLSARSVQLHCQKGNIVGVNLQGKSWMIPEGAERPKRKPFGLKSFGYSHLIKEGEL